MSKATLEEMTKMCNELGSYWCFQGERGDTGYEHWQGAISLKKRRRKNELLGVMAENDLVKPEHLEPINTNLAKKIKNIRHMMDSYCAKLDTRISGPFHNEAMSDRYIPRQFRNMELRPWQQKLLDMAKEFSHRIINWVYDPVGNNGKTTVASIAELTANAIDLPVPPMKDFQEILQSLCDICMSRDMRDPNPIFLDLPRCIKKDNVGELLAACEQIKKGKLFDKRHSYKEYWIDSPSLWIFSNTQPPTSALSKDGWRVWTIHDNDLIPYEELNEIDLICD